MLNAFLLHYVLLPVRYHRPLTRYEFNYALTEATKEKPLSKRARLCVYKIAQRESGLDNLCRNPKSTAYGLGQLLRSTRKDGGELEVLKKNRWHRGDHPVHQLRIMVKYIVKRFGTPERAWAYWRVHHVY